uniref:Pirin n=1 Tax=Sinocyclocheilus anshuiensis TaxID=1608454 RepID=A0A671NTW7_9TELE
MMTSYPASRVLLRAALSVGHDMQSIHAVRRTSSAENIDSFLLFQWSNGKPLQADFVNWKHVYVIYVTYLLSGITAHEDSCGHSRGVIHAEMPVSEGRIHGLQLWVNLKSADKMVEPQYQELKSKEIPKPSKDGVILISFSGWTAFIYTLAGPDDDLQTIEPHHTVVLEDGECVRAAEESHFVLIAGEPINEPVVHHEPFVMNIQEEIDQAISDYRSATNGFERAKVWQSKIGQKF